MNFRAGTNNLTQLNNDVRGRLSYQFKAIETTLPVHEAQVLTDLKLSGHRLGLLLNFNVPRIKDGIKRIVL